MIQILIGLYQWVQINGATVVAAIMGILSVAELIVRLTPTKKDDTAVERVGTFIRKMFDVLGVPNKAQGGGEHYDAKEVMVVPKPEVLQKEIEDEKKAA